ncbi:DUF342 domain-containing protein, partial [Paenibacillus sp. TAF58]
MLERNMPLDFYISISISDDKLTAYLLINNAEDDFKVTAGQLEEFAQTNHIVNGLNRSLLA